jgi:hypothetical protein
MNLTGPRLSTIARCPRAGALQAAGHPPAEPSDRQRGLFKRGHLFGDYAYQQLLERYDASEIEREREIPWNMFAPHGRLFEGVGHADFYIPAEKKLIEVKSSTDIYGGIIDTASTQVRLYMLFDQEAESAVVYHINAVDMFEDWIEIKMRDGDREELATLLADVAAGADGGPLPQCNQGSPSACRQSHCLFTEPAWAGWQHPLAVHEPSPELEQMLRQWNAMKDVERQAEPAYKRRKEIEQELIDAGLKVGENHIGDWVVKRRQQKGRTTFSYATADKAGALDGLEEVLAPFVKVGEPSERFEVINLA